jgi:hypothetical protein
MNSYTIDDFITGEKFQILADMFVGTNHEFNINPYIRNHMSKCIDLYSINDNFNNHRIIFCYGHRLDLLINKLKYFNNKFILISHNSDCNIDETYRSLLDSDKIIKWYAQNVNINHYKLHILPIGIANSMWAHGNLPVLENTLKSMPLKDKDCYFYFNIHTNYTERMACKIQLENRGLIFGENKNFEEYINELSRYKFAICPPGNGLDCHRIWECYYLRVIPIVITSIFAENLSKQFPCIILNKWDDFDLNDILVQYDNLISKLDNNYLRYDTYKKMLEIL